MNDALNYYHSYNDIWHINGFSVVNDSNKKNDIYLTRLMSCWGWATWEDRWYFYKKDPDSLISNFSKKDIEKFDLDNSANFWDQVVENKIGLINTWAVFWYAVIFSKKDSVLPQSILM